MWSTIPVALLCMNVNWNERKQGSGPESERVDFRPERTKEQNDGWTDERTNKSPPVFYRTSSPSGPLPKKR